MKRYNLSESLRQLMLALHPEQLTDDRNREAMYWLCQEFEKHIQVWSDKNLLESYNDCVNKMISFGSKERRVAV